MTGRDYLRSLSNEALASWIVSGEHAQEPNLATARAKLLEWLRTEEPYRVPEIARYGPNAPKFRYIFADEDTKPEETDWNTVSIGALQLTARAYNLLYCAGIKTVGAVLKKRKYDIMCLRNCGNHTADEVAMKVERLTGRKMEL